MVTPTYSNSFWLLSAVYASPRFAERGLLWENLITVPGLHSLPWVIDDDFNEVLMGEDKFKRRFVNINRALRFQECLDTCMMIDIEWNILFPEALVQHLKSAHSNHCPVLLCLDKNHDVRLPQPFKFQPMWLSHPTFPDVIRNAWSNPTVLSSAVAKFVDKAKIWNKNIFRNLSTRKRECLQDSGVFKQPFLQTLATSWWN
ncbi:uncharacterized protein LOC142633034 [Castanea sativa]|uniref:uncharacterized protein LOC142633034 n=1 Tax=Castanea sativa TaxID=21020 RepID=UPI003F64F7E8